MPKKRTIGVLASETGVKVTTIRYYESVGLLNEPDRTPSGQRVYEPDAVDRLDFIRHARELGFSMPAIRELITLQGRSDEDCTQVDQIARRQLANVRQRLAKLTFLEAELARLVRSCAGGKVGNCQVIASLSDHNACTADHPKPEPTVF